MKAIQITLDEKLLATLDSDDEVKRVGRSAVIRRALAEYLRKKRHTLIADAYGKGYNEHPAKEDFSGWSRQGVWPED